MAEFLIGFTISTFFTLVGYLTRPKPLSRQSPNSGLTSLRADSPIPFVFGRQSVGGNIFAITDTDIKGKKMSCWVALAEGPICSIYDMKINDKPLSDVSATRVSDSGSYDKFMRFLFEYWNGGISENEPQEELSTLNTLASDLDVTKLSKPGNEIHPGTAYFGINVRAGTETGRVPSFSSFIEGSLLPKIPQEDGSILLYISDHNKYLTWAYDNTESDPFDPIELSKLRRRVPNFRKRWVHHTANLLNFYDTGAGITYQSTPATSLELNIEDLCLTIQAAMNYYHAAGSYSVSTSSGGYVQTEKVLISASLPFILTSRTGGHYQDSIFEDLGFRTTHDLGIWDLGVDYANTNNTTAPFHLEWPWFLGVNDKKHHEIPGMSISIIGWPLRTLSGRTEFLADFTYDRTFSDNPARVFYFMETVVFNKSVDVSSFYETEKSFNYLLDGFYDKVLLSTHDLDIELPLDTWLSEARIDVSALLSEAGIDVSASYMGDRNFIGSYSYIHDNGYVTVIKGTPLSNDVLLKNPVSFMFNNSSNNYGVIIIPATNIHSRYKSDAYLIIDLGKEREISEISIEQEFSYNFLIQYSTDKSSWTDLHDRGISGDYTFEEDDFVQIYSSRTPITARYLKITNISYGTINEQQDIIEGRKFTGYKDKSVAAWVVRRIRIYEAYLARRFRCDLTVDSSITRKEFHAFMSANYGIFKTSIDSSDTTKIGLYKEEDTVEVIDQDMFIKGTIKLHSIPASESFNSLLYSFFDINQDFASHPIILNDDADQARQLRNLSGNYESYVIQGPRQHLVGHCREQQAFRFAESKMKALKLASFVVEIEATKNAALLQIGTVYKLNYAEWSLDGAVDYILNEFQGRLIKRIRYNDERYLLLFEQHDNNVFSLTPREFTPVKSFTRPNPTLVTPVTNIEIELIKTNSLFNPGNIYFNITWDMPLHNNGFIGTEIHYKIKNTEYDSIEDYTFLKRSDGKLFSMIAIPQNFIPNLVISFMLYSVTSNGSISTSAAFKSVTLTEEMFKSDPVVNLHIANEKDIFEHPNYYIEDDLYLSWSDISNTGQNTGEYINRENSGTANKLTSQFNLAYYKIYIQGKIYKNDETWHTIKTYQQYSTDFTYTPQQNYSDFLSYVFNVFDDNVIDVDSPLSDIRIGISKVNVFEIESDIVWIECIHVGDWRKVRTPIIADVLSMNGYGPAHIRAIDHDTASTLCALYWNEDELSSPLSILENVFSTSLSYSSLTTLVVLNNALLDDTFFDFKCAFTIDGRLHISYIKQDGSDYKCYYAQDYGSTLVAGGTGSEVTLFTLDGASYPYICDICASKSGLKQFAISVYEPNHSSGYANFEIKIYDFSIATPSLNKSLLTNIEIPTGHEIVKFCTKYSEDDNYIHVLYTTNDTSTHTKCSLFYLKCDIVNGFVVFQKKINTFDVFNIYECQRISMVYIEDELIYFIQVLNNNTCILYRYKVIDEDLILIKKQVLDFTDMFNGFVQMNAFSYIASTNSLVAYMYDFTSDYIKSVTFKLSKI